MKLVEQLGLRSWSEIAEALAFKYPTFRKSGKQCRERYLALFLSFLKVHKPLGPKSEEEREGLVVGRGRYCVRADPLETR